MPDQYLGRLTADMDVCDLDGHKLGKVARVYRDEFSVYKTAGESNSGESAYPSVMEVKSGPLGFGARLFIPLTAIEDATAECVFVAKKKGDSTEEWRHKPEYLDRLH
jgi:hypothetical protein